MNVTFAVLYPVKYRSLDTGRGLSEDTYIIKGSEQTKDGSHWTALSSTAKVSKFQEKR